MKLQKAITVAELSKYFDLKILGDSNALITGINEIHKVENGDLCFVDHPKYYQKVLQSSASFILIDKEVNCPEGKVLIVYNNPFEVYEFLTKKYAPFIPNIESISKSATIDDTTQLQANVTIGNHVRIGKHCLIHSGVVIYDHTIIEDNVIIHANSVIGSDAFYYKKNTNKTLHYSKMHSCGHVHIACDVEIGSSCTIDRGVSGITYIGAGTKLDNQVHVGHGVVIGKNCLIAAQVGIAGKTILEDQVTLWGQVGVNKSLRIGSGAEVYAQSGVPSSIEGGKKYFGSPVIDAKEKIKEMVWVKRIPLIWEKLTK